MIDFKNLDNEQLIQQYKGLPKIHGLIEVTAQRAHMLSIEKLAEIDAEIEQRKNIQEKYDEEIKRRAKIENISGTDFYYKYGG